MTASARRGERIRDAHAKAMEALAADVHPYSATAIREWEQQLEGELSALLAAAAAAEQERDDAHREHLEAHIRAEAAVARAAALADILGGFLHDADNGDHPGVGLRSRARAALVSAENGQT